MIKTLLMLAPLFCMTALCAKDFGNRAHYFPIQEESIQKHFAKQMQSPNLDPKVLAKSAAHPKPVEGITEAKSPKSYLYTPCYTAEKDITDHEGKVIVKKGVSYNPLEHSQPSSKLLFIDGTNKDHIAWATTYNPTDKIILINGSPLDLEADLKRPVYFDQMGCYTTAFQIEHVPAKVSTQGKSLLIEEVPISKAKETSNG